MSELSDYPNRGNPSSDNPTSDIPLDFRRFMELRRGEPSADELAAVEGPDYADPDDRRLRRRLGAVAAMREVVERALSACFPLAGRLEELGAERVGPGRHRALNHLRRRCADRLAMPAPALAVRPGDQPAACVVEGRGGEAGERATVVLTSALAEGLSEAELSFVLGHEYGHLHNRHGGYNSALQLVENRLARQLVGQLAENTPALVVATSLRHVQSLVDNLQGGLKAQLLRWGQSAEVTCDRAGLIVCGDLTAAERALAGLANGSGEGPVAPDESRAQIGGAAAVAARIERLGRFEATRGTAGGRGGEDR